MILRDAGLVEARKDGLQVFYRLIDAQAAEWLTAILGPANTEGPAVLDSCPCPRCAEVISADLSILRR
jgi:DNA-binding transcriptional ArsR family regulator